MLICTNHADMQDVDNKCKGMLERDYMHSMAAFKQQCDYYEDGLIRPNTVRTVGQKKWNVNNTAFSAANIDDILEKSLYTPAHFYTLWSYDGNGNHKRFDAGDALDQHITNVAGGNRACVLFALPNGEEPCFSSSSSSMNVF